MSKIQLPAVKPKRTPWNKGRLVGQKRPLLPKQVWAIRARLELAGNLRDLAMINLGIDSKLRGLLPFVFSDRSYGKHFPTDAFEPKADRCYSVNQCPKSAGFLTFSIVIDLVQKWIAEPSM